MTLKKIMVLGLGISLLAGGVTVSASNESCDSFSDVDTGTVYCASIDTLKEEKIISGYPDNTYKPYQAISRAEFTKIIMGALFDANTIDSCMKKVQEPLFNDTSNSEWYAKYLCVAKEKNIITGYDDGSFQPANSIVLSEAAKIISTGFKLPMSSTESEPWYKRYIDGLSYAHAIPVSFKRFDQKLNRAEMAEMVTRLRIEDFSQTSQDYPKIATISQPEEIIDTFSSSLESSGGNAIKGTFEGYLWNDVFDFTIHLNHAGEKINLTDAALTDGNGLKFFIEMISHKTDDITTAHGTWNDLSSDALNALNGGKLKFEANGGDLTGMIRQNTSRFTDFALYDPNKEEDGVWEEDATAIKSLLNEFGYTYTVIDAEDINKGRLFNETGRYKGIVMVGGWAYTRSVRMNAEGKTHLREFLQQGGNYIGFCAGVYFAAGTIEFATEASGGEGTYNQEKDYLDYSEYYNNDILKEGKIRGPFGWTPWGDGLTINYEIAKINTNNQTMKTIGLPTTTRFPYAGGPFFEIEAGDEPENYQIWAYSQKPGGPPTEASIGEGKPTIIRYHYGKGEVILFSYHPEILIESDRDNIQSLTQYYQENEIEWNRGEQTQEEINHNSWNIVHAAVQVAANEMPTPMGD